MRVHQQVSEANQVIGSVSKLPADSIAFSQIASEIEENNILIAERLRAHDPEIYGRFSIDLQKEDSIEQQLLACRDEASKDGNVIPQERVFADTSIRGSEDDRPELNRMQNLIRSGVKCTDLYIFDTSRLARDREIAASKQKFFNHYPLQPSILVST